MAILAMNITGRMPVPRRAQNGCRKDTNLSLHCRADITPPGSCPDKVGRAKARRYEAHIVGGGNDESRDAV
jgi:hypothetical protein